MIMCFYCFYPMHYDFIATLFSCVHSELWECNSELVWDINNIVSLKHQAARAMANLAAHGDSNSNNAAVGQEAGALEALVQLTRSPHEGVR